MVLGDVGDIAQAGVIVHFLMIDFMYVIADYITKTTNRRGYCEYA